MLQEIALTPSTIILVAIIVVGAVFAIRRMIRRGLCDCSDHCDGCSEAGHCSSCSAAERMVENLRKQLPNSDDGKAN